MILSSQAPWPRLASIHFCCFNIVLHIFTLVSRLHSASPSADVLLDRYQKLVNTIEYNWTLCTVLVNPFIWQRHDQNMSKLTDKCMIMHAYITLSFNIWYLYQYNIYAWIYRFMCRFLLIFVGTAPLQSYRCTIHVQTAFPIYEWEGIFVGHIDREDGVRASACRLRLCPQCTTWVVCVFAEPVDPAVGKSDGAKSRV